MAAGAASAAAKEVEAAQEATVAVGLARVMAEEEATVVVAGMEAATDSGR